MSFTVPILFDIFQYLSSFFRTILDIFSQIMKVILFNLLCESSEYIFPVSHRISPPRRPLISIPLVELRNHPGNNFWSPLQ